MLAIVERYLQALKSARSDSDINRILGEAADGFGFRSAFLLEYTTDMKGVRHVIDTNPKRRAWWPQFFTSDLRPPLSEVNALLQRGPVVEFNAGTVGHTDRLRAVSETYDITSVHAVPISHQGQIVGIAGFCGARDLDQQESMALQLIAYTMFAEIRASTHIQTESHSVALTPREREVMQLSAEGMTSSEIAERLGMSPRTANQHADNVADKLGTRNRAHTVAEIVRRGLLN